MRNTHIVNSYYSPETEVTNEFSNQSPVWHKGGGGGGGVRDEKYEKYDNVK